MDLQALEFHPFSNLFPLLQGEDFTNLAKDIELHGQREPIILFEGRILDGRNRYRACLELGREPDTRPFEGANALEFVLSLNLHRRQLTIAQRAVIAAELSALREREAKVSAPGEASHDSAMGIEQAARLLGISPRSVSSASRVVREGAPELVEAVRTGKVSVSGAEHVSKLDRTRQQEICAQGTRALSKAAREIRLKDKPSAPAKTPSAPAATPMLQDVLLVEQTGLQPAAPHAAAKKPTALKLFELADEAMQEGREPETVAEALLAELEEGIDHQRLLFTIEVAIHLRDRVTARD
ncbi:ParB/RepB/Spo0J family partition protein [Azotobacter armeniacus]